MRLADSRQSQLMDQLAQNQFGLTSEVLMESAGAAVAEEVHLIFKDKKRKILILIGPGNNGADGFVTARVLKRKGFTEIQCVLISSSSSPSDIWKKQLDRAKDLEIKTDEFSTTRLHLAISESDLIIDSIFGTGFNRRLTQEMVELFTYINSKKKIVVAVDSPSGLNVDTGQLEPEAIRANLTVTFGLAKPGFYISKGTRYVGRIKVHHIGFPKKLLVQNANTYFAFGAKAAAKTMPTHEYNQNKSHFGAVHVFAGSEDYPGAGILCANAAGRLGAGYVYLHGLSNLYSQISQIPEVVYRPIEKFNINDIENSHAFVVGPGLGINSQVKDLIMTLKKKKIQKVILDADAISVCRENNLWPLPSSWILTPHTGELSKLIEVSVKNIEQDRIAALKIATEKTGCVVLLKGFHSIVSASRNTLEKHIIVLAGNVALAKAGSGDVLSGFIGALLAQGLEPINAACLGAYIHGRLADDWIKKGNDVITLLPSDLTHNVPELVKRIRDGL
jgi:ADP-dependent NAD(P)H-hydrate dehydratase / NAD(P)H-hydrate epimerase